jgi:hypothetical protein
MADNRVPLWAAGQRCGEGPLLLIALQYDYGAEESRFD